MPDADLTTDSLKIAGLSIPNRALLAPMSGVSDLPFRRLAARYGAGLVVSEMVACDAVQRQSEEARLRAEGEGLSLHVVQLAARDEEAMSEGVRIAEAAGASIIDINMGCPAKRVTGGFAGSHLMRDLDIAERLIASAVRTAKVPVTLKMRLGWDHTSLNAAQLAQRAENVGVAMVTVHGRTRSQFYKGAADWDAIRPVVRAVRIPVIANGDLTRPEDAPKMLQRSGAAGVMIGRGAYGRPWIVGQTGDVLKGKIPRPDPTGRERADLIMEHYDMILAHYGPVPGVRIARKHLAWYLDDFAMDAQAQAARGKLLRETEPQRVKTELAALLPDLGADAASLREAA
ncbi:tRNA-dihydrouridine synthase B [Rhodopseudomonas julia]|uniref:tRNA-dihydrouridine synthase n=1 Tax=Rhodopseudomonas julia TaxID=200617 RepID=A0ABU0C9G0_9BRAD|nr:tRNA dihydrouridine synthase DusB [Rhodopseudomonas julia]MDQ0327160.1 tRNA-dihydrouridine synthase B [Rhodopseudomonas julia]